MKIGKLVTRLVIGGLFVGHGTQKLFGWFDGPGMDATAETFESMGLRPGRRHAMAAGLMTPVAVSMLSGVMLSAIRKVHLKNGPWVTKGGYEYNLVLLAALMALADGGPGSPSLDSGLGIEKRGAGWALAALAAGAAGSQLAVTAGERQQEHRPSQTQAQQAEPAQREAA